MFEEKRLELLSNYKGFMTFCDKGEQEFVGYTSYLGKWYNPSNNFAPLDGGKELTASEIMDAVTGFQNAVVCWTEPSGPETELGKLIAKATAELSVSKVLESVKPLLHEFIKKEYGVLPQTIEVKVPNKEPKRISGLVHKVFEDVLQEVTMGKIPLLVGPAGTGKTKIAEQVAKALGLEFYLISKFDFEHEYNGFIDANGNYTETALYRAWINGGVVLLDEADCCASSALKKLNEATGSRRHIFPVQTSISTAHDDFHFIMAANTLGNGADDAYTAGNALDVSSLDRVIVEEVDYDERVELMLANNDQQLVDFAHSMRKAIEKSQLSRYVITYRGIQNVADLAPVFGIEKAIKKAITNKMECDDVRHIKENMYVNNKYMDALNNIVAQF